MSFLSPTTLPSFSIPKFQVATCHQLAALQYLSIQDPWQPTQRDKLPLKTDKKDNDKRNRRTCLLLCQVISSNQSTTRSFIHSLIHSSSFFTLDWAVSEIETPLLPLTHSKELLPHYAHPNSSNLSIRIIWPETRTSELSDHFT